MMVELFGLTGVGKSTLAKNMAGAGLGEIVKISSKFELVYYNMIFFFTHPIKFVVLFLYVLKNSQETGLFYLKFMNTFLLHNAKYQKAKSQKQTIIDQGFMQNLLSVFEKELILSDLKKYLRYLCYPDMLLVLDASDEVISRRQANRGYGARANMPVAYLDRWQGVVRRNYELILANIDLLPTRSFILSAEADSQELLNKIKDILNKHE